MRRGILVSIIASCSLALACGENKSDGNEQADGETVDDEVGTEQGTDDEIGTDQGDTFTTTVGDGDGDTNTTTMGDGDGDTNTDTMTDTTDATDSSETGEECGTTLYSTVRDFQIAHPDFEYTIGVDLGIVANALGMDKKPVYAGNPNTPTTTGAANFNQWYNDVMGINQTFDVPIDLVEIQPGLYQYSNSDFFPIDDQGWGNEGNIHNYHFTLELHSKFQYLGGEVFGFEGDDDLWVFVNGKLAIDLGGVHGPLAGNVDMDAQANNLGLQQGHVYDLDFFFAERHTTQSNFEITTTISCFEPQ
jgi:fibro-slime domain-containing protein